jgi:hypothetical protein
MTCVTTLIRLSGRALELGCELLAKWGYKRADDLLCVFFSHDMCDNFIPPFRACIGVGSQAAGQVGLQRR